MNQLELENSARYFVGIGLVFANDFINKNIGAEKMKKLSLFGAYVIKMNEPIPCLFISFGAGGSFIPNSPVSKVLAVSKTEAEHMYLAWLIKDIDPENKYQLRAYQYHLDLAHGSIIKRPTDEDIANMHLRYRDGKNPPKKVGGKSRFTVKSMSKQATNTVISRRNRDERFARELRALDRRRFMETGIVPPPERSKQLAIIKDGPRRGGLKVKFNKLDSYRSDTDEEDIGEISKIGNAIETPWNPFDDSSSSDSDEEDDNKKARGGEVIATDDDETIQPPEKRLKSSAKSEPILLEKVLIGMREGYLQKHPLQ